MDYQIRIPRIYGNVVPLVAVAEAMARGRATAYGTHEYLASAYDGEYRRVSAGLIREILAGRLQVCDPSGFLADPNEIVAQMDTAYRYVVEPDWAAIKARHPEAKQVCDQSGCLGDPNEIVEQMGKAGRYVVENEHEFWDFREIDIDVDLNWGEKEVDEVQTKLLNYHATLASLNRWGEQSGNVFSLDPNGPPWTDERGCSDRVDIETRQSRLNRLDQNGPWSPDEYGSWEKMEPMVQAREAAAATQAAPAIEPVTTAAVLMGMQSQESAKGDAAWIDKARDFAKEYIDRHKAQKLFPSQVDVCSFLETQLRENRIFGLQGKPLKAAYIQRNAIQGQWWSENKP